MTSSTRPSAHPVDQKKSRLTISAFAEAVGLTPSALRFYDDAGLLAPATVDRHNGYRYYDDSQRRRAILVRQMRELDVPLVTMRTVLDGRPGQAEQLLAEHVARLTDRAERAQATVAEVLRALQVNSEVRPAPTEFTVGGPELAGAIRQVAPFASGDEAALDCLLLDVTDDELTVVGTDRYRLGARTLPITDLSGPERRLPVTAIELSAVAPWLRRQFRLRVTVTPGDHSDDPLSLILGSAESPHDQQPHDQPIHDQQAQDQQLHRAAETRCLTIRSDLFPDYRQVLSSSAEPSVRHRMITDRIRLLELVATDHTSTVLVQPEEDAVIVSRLNDPEVHRLPAVCSGPAHRVAFSPELLASALQSSVGPDVLIDSAPGRPAVIRSADEGSFSTLVMPRRLDDDPAPYGGNG